MRVGGRPPPTPPVSWRVCRIPACSPGCWRFLSSWKTICSSRSTSRTCCANLAPSRVDIAKSVGEALELIGQRSYSFALLDVKLGMDNSLPVARALLPTGTRMVFGTGYGEAKSLDAALASVPVMSKPYHPKSLAQVLSRLPAPSGHPAGK